MEREELTLSTRLGKIARSHFSGVFGVSRIFGGLWPEAEQAGAVACTKVESLRIYDK